MQQDSWVAIEGPKSPDVVIRDDVVVKTFATEMEREIEKFEAIRAVSLKSGFIAPEILEKKGNEVVFKRIRFSRMMYDVYLHAITGGELSEADLELFRTCGEALAMIHKHLQLSERVEWQPRKAIAEGVVRVSGMTIEELLKDTPRAFHHCDYTLTNLGVCPAEDGKSAKVIVFDPSPNLYSSNSVCDYGSIYVDIGVFLSNLAGRIPMKYFFKAHWNRLDAIRRAFLTGYEKAAGVAIDDALAQQIGYGISFSHFSRYPSWRRAISMKLLYNGYKKNMPPKRR